LGSMDSLRLTIISVVSFEPPSDNANDLEAVVEVVDADGLPHELRVAMTRDVLDELASLAAVYLRWPAGRSWPSPEADPSVDVKARGPTTPP
jgi:hypothetical protein